MSSRDTIVSRANLVRYVYTLGVMVTGVFLSQRIGGFDSPTLWVSVFVFALGWIAYYHFAVVPRFEYLGDRDQKLPDHSD